jgi:chromosome segregation protein
MTYIKKLVMKGFKSFARETTINLDRHMNVIVGPNGSGKSNITDALCFVLGRLSIKSIRAAKASHLIFSGNKEYKSANLAFVEIILDNEDKTFALDSNEISIKRIVKKNGQSVYKINNNNRTRQEVLELLGQAGIDPHGFNIILQGEIQRFVKMGAEERRKVIEEVAGISIYEMRKDKSLKELERTNEKLKQINAILRERTNYLRNLETEREQALRYKRLQETVKRCKASIINKNIQERDREIKENLSKLQDKEKAMQKKDDYISKIGKEIEELNINADQISKTIQKSSGLEQDKLNAEISSLRQEIAGMIARKENYENQLLELDRRKQSLESAVKSSEREIEDMKKANPKNLKRDLEEKKARLDELDELKRQHYLIKSNISSITTQISDKKGQIQNIKNESNFLLDQIQQIESEIKIKESVEHQSKNLKKLKELLARERDEIAELESALLENEKSSAVNKRTIEQAERIKSQVGKIDICPLCKTKITSEHIGQVIKEADKEITESKESIENAENQINLLNEKLKKLKEKISVQEIEISQRNIDIVKIQSIEDKKSNLKRNAEKITEYESELDRLEAKKKDFDKKSSLTRLSEEQYENLKLEVNELQRSEERNLGLEITTKQREMDRIKIAIKQNHRDREEITEELKDINSILEEKEEIVEEKEGQAEELKNKYQKMFEHKNSLQDKVRIMESDLMKHQNEKRITENEINNLKIEKAQISARKDTLLEEIKEFKGVEFIPLTIEKLKEKLQNSENLLSRIGNVNLRALEVYEDIKKEYDKIKEKVEQLEKEKEEILKIIEQVDRKKKKVFLKTLNDINELFSRNFSQLSQKGIVILEPQDKKEVFNAGINIIVKVGGGKYFDITSLSGGEQTLVALSLIFAIQEFSPYCFYIFDEIDAALDRRNSEKLAYLLKKHMKKGQYLIITHNDSIISESSTILYGVSMQEGISKVLSIEV